MEHIRHYLVIKAPVQKVYEAITTQDGLSKWWTKEAIAKPEEGFLNEFFFAKDDHQKMRVTHLDTNKAVHWTCEEGDPEWVNTKFSFELAEKDGKTILQFAHKDWREATDFYASCNYHWGYFMHSLKKLCETGQGTPYPEVD